MNVIIDTPKGRQNKFSWDKQVPLFELSGVLPPAQFSLMTSVSSRTRPDRDELDVLVLMDEPTLPAAWCGRARSA